MPCFPCETVRGNDGFYCRKCYRLVYRSQQSGNLDWALEKQRKIERQLDGKMRRTKRAKLEDQFYELDDYVAGCLLDSLLIRYYDRIAR